MAFESKIPTVFQICPPYMPLDLQSFSGQYTPVVDNAAGVTQVGYEDVASCIVTALEQPQDYNRKMMGIGRK
jgi:hypothetical protein